MTKQEFISTVAEKAGFSKKETSTLINAAIKTIEETILNNDKIVFNGFGTFESRQRKARNGYNPSTGEEIIIPAKRIAYFHPSGTLRDAIIKHDAAAVKTKRRKK